MVFCESYGKDAGGTDDIGAGQSGLPCIDDVVDEEWKVSLPEVLLVVLLRISGHPFHLDIDSGDVDPDVFEPVQGRMRVGAEDIEDTYVLSFFKAVFPYFPGERKRVSGCPLMSGYRDEKGPVRDMGGKAFDLPPDGRRIVVFHQVAVVTYAFVRQRTGYPEAGLGHC